MRNLGVPGLVLGFSVVFGGDCFGAALMVVITVMLFGGRMVFLGFDCFGR